MFDLIRKHLYTDMERISRIWEIELQAVLEINKIGHRKRILYSVGAVPPKNDKILEKFTKALSVRFLHFLSPIITVNIECNFYLFCFD